MPGKKPTYKQLAKKVRELEKELAERKKVEVELDLFKKIVDSSSEPIAASTPDGKLIYINPAHEKLFGRSLEEARKLNYRFFYPEESVKILDRDVAPLLARGESWEGQLTAIDAKGRLFHLWEKADSVVDEDGKMLFALGIMSDISERRQAQLVLEQSESKYRHLTENARDTLYRMKLPGGEYEYISPAAKSLFGYSPEDFYRTPLLIREVIHPDFQDYFTEQWEKLIAGEMPAFYEYKIIDRAGNEKWLYQRNAMVRGDGDTPVAIEGIITDVTDRKQAEEALWQSEDRLQLAMDAGDHAFWDYNIDNGEVFFSPRYYTMLGYEVGELPERLDTWMELLHPEDRKNVAPEIIGYVGKGKPYSVEFRMKCKNGSYKWISGRGKSFEIDENGVPHRAVGIHVDITERKEGEEELRRSRALLRTVIDTVPNYICAKDLDGKFLLVNKALASFYGTTVEELTGKLHEDICEDAEELEAMLASDRDVIESGKAKIVIEESMRSPDGSETYLETSKVPFAIFGDPAVLIMSRDIAELKQLEDERSKAAKLESIGLLAGGIAHDFNNILTAVLGNISLAIVYSETDCTKARKLLSEAEKATLSAKDLTMQLLTFSRGGEPVKETLVVSDLIADTARFALRGSNVKRELDFDGNLWPVDVDAGQLKQVINNIVINASQAMPGGGVISIRATNITVAAKDSLQLAEGKYINITIKDQGIGIAEEYLAQVFDPYFTTKQKGSGLGLATSYSIVKRHNGHIVVESEQGSGTTFQIYLPASYGIVAEKEEEEAALTAVSGKILIMDDEQIVLDVVSKILERVGSEVVVAINGTEAVKEYDKAARSEKPFDLVILDLTIQGGMGGLETLDELRKLDPDVKAIVSSGYSNDPVLANYKDYGFKSMVSKPYRIKELTRVLLEVLEE